MMPKKTACNSWNYQHPKYRRKHLQLLRGEMDFFHWQYPQFKRHPWKSHHVCFCLFVCWFLTPSFKHGFVMFVLTSNERAFFNGGWLPVIWNMNKPCGNSLTFYLFHEILRFGMELASKASCHWHMFRICNENPFGKKVNEFLHLIIGAIGQNRSTFRNRLSLSLYIYMWWWCTLPAKTIVFLM